jgi:hypothetical protein
MEPIYKTTDDLIDDYHKRLEQIPWWNNEKRQLITDLSDKLSNAGFRFFDNNPSRCFELTGLGNSTVQAIPAKQRGNLKYWRGQVVRIVCIGPGRYKRTYAVGLTIRKPEG